MRYIMGIDPDLHKSGVSIYDRQEKLFFECRTATMWELFDLIKIFSREHYNDLEICLEYPDNTNTWHKGGKGAAINVGKNQAVAIIIKEYAESLLVYCGLKLRLMKPAGYSNLFKDKEIFKRTTGIGHVTNEDARASAAIVWVNK